MTYWLKFASVPLAALAAVYVLLFAIIAHAWWALALGGLLVGFVMWATFTRWPARLQVTDVRRGTEGGSIG